MAKTNKKKKTAKQKRIMIASILIAAAIAMGSTFAWFTSKDSVTNRLTASADYGVEITEDFTPPEDWTPGQAINKDVSAVNTGNVSAFVKLTLSNLLKVTYESTATVGENNGDIKIDSSTNKPSVVDSTSSGTTSLVKLDTYDTDSDGIYDEVEALEAGGILVAAYTQSTSDSTTTTSPIVLTAASGQTAATTVTLGVTGTKYKPTKAGYYIFRRAVDDSTTDKANAELKSTEEFEYTGFYFDGSSTYYKIKVECKTEPDYGTDGNTVTDTSTADGIADNGAFTVSFVTKVEGTATEPTFTYESASENYSYANDKGTQVHTSSYHPDRIIARYDRNGDSYNSSSGALLTDETKLDDDIVIYINLASGAVNNTTPSSGNWTYGGLNGDSTEAYFYLNSLLEPGKTSGMLVDSVELAESTTAGAYIDFTYDLNIDLDSVQAVYKQNDTTGNTTIDTDKSKAAAEAELLKSTEVGTNITVNDTTTYYAFNTVKVTAGTTADKDSNIESGTVGWSYVAPTTTP